MPMARDSTRATVPRRKGRFKMRKRSEMEFTFFISTSIFPSGVRTAVAACLGPRIITPSMTAWPPTVNLSLMEPSF